ncbi:MAG: alkaline phosphatase family protein [Phycisphaerales bacterium]|nr:MAG: alkaline phosphatase family protein [Phycisphaerales bacterium]
MARESIHGATHIAFDLDGDGSPDYTQAYRGPVKRVFLFRAADDANPRHHVVDWDDLDPANERHLFLLLDGVPYDAMAELWSEGRFRLFHRPGLLISTLPSLTDPSFAQILQAEPPCGYESCYFQRGRNRLTNGTQTYLRGDNEPWNSALDYRLNFIEDAIMYLFPGYVFRRELENARRTLLRSERHHPVVYLLSTDGLGHMQKRTEVLRYLRLLDRWIERLIYEQGARLQITMLADHGNSFVATEPFRLKELLQQAGLHASRSLKKQGDVVVPEFGLIDFAALYVFDANTLHRVVEVCRRDPAVELICYRQAQPPGIIVLNGRQRALIHRVEQPVRYGYVQLSGDPLRLAQTIRRLKQIGQLSEDGLAHDRAWLQATRHHVFPDPLHRIWQALTENTRNPADVLLSLTPGYHVGDPSLDAWARMEGTHGGLRAASSNTFIMSTALQVPPWQRPADVLKRIQATVAWQPRVGGSASRSPAHQKTQDISQVIP